MKVGSSSSRVLLLLLTLWAAGSNAQLSVCGAAPLNTRSDTRIVGGQEAAAGAWPWQAKLRIQGGLCGGSLINSQWVLSAAHCFESTSTSGVTVDLGLQSLTSSANVVSRSAAQIIVHPDYNSNTNDNDLALVQLSSAVTFTNYVRPVCLAADGSVFPSGLDCWVTGWGTLSYGGSVSQTLQEVDVPIVSNSQCSASYSTLTNNMLCAGLTNGGKDSCQGDSGGPLVTKNGTVWVQAGVVSYGNGCAQPGYPGVYARISNYQTWINSQVSGEQPGYISFQGAAAAARRLAASLLAVPMLSLALLLS
ncbi:trypsin I-P1-like [Xiphophorus hellerii]|uniref:trypsin I-P1-like n=1 Tax=Xiphophorus hellerii TaxID=8084 RepID=UPI0013B43CF7|nr:trypsin I-P1-like [Xiphophorus hellerii]